MANTVFCSRVIADSSSGLHREGRERDRQPGRPRKLHRGPEKISSLAEDTVVGTARHLSISMQRIETPVEVTCARGAVKTDD